MTFRKGPKYFFLIVILALGTILSAAPSMASPPGRAVGRGVHCHWRHVSGHWVWTNGHRYWVAPRNVRVCG